MSPEKKNLFFSIIRQFSGNFFLFLRFWENNFLFLEFLWNLFFYLAPLGCRRGPGIPYIPISGDRYHNIPISQGQNPNIRNLVRLTCPYWHLNGPGHFFLDPPLTPISQFWLSISQYPNLRKAISQYPRENDQYPNIPIWLTPPLYYDSTFPFSSIRIPGYMDIIQ